MVHDFLEDHPMIGRRIALFLTAAVATICAREPQAPAATIKELAGYMERHRQFAAREAAALAGPREKRSSSQRKVTALHRPYDARQVKRLKGQLKSHQDAAAHIEEELASMRIKEPEARAAKLKEAETEMAAARTALLAARTPLNQEYAKIQQSGKAAEQKMVGLAELVPRTPEEHGVAESTITARAGGATITVGWQDAQGHGLAQLHLQLLAAPARSHRVMKLAGKYPVQHISDYAVSFSVGTIGASFSGRKKEWRDREKLPKLVEALVDFEALAGIDAALAKDGDLRKELVGCAARQKQWQSRMQGATGDIQSRLSLVGRSRNELRKPYDPGRVVKLEQRLASQKRYLAGIRAELSAATIQDPEKRKAERLKAAQDSKQAQEDLLTAAVPLRAEQVALGKAERTARFGLWELVDSVVHMPKEIGTVAPEVRANIRNVSANVSWRDGRTTQLVRAEFRFLPVPPETSLKDKVADKFPVQSWGASSVTFWTGSVNVSLSVEKAEWQSKEKMLELATKLIDLDAIAAWPRIGDTE